ncbi:MAG: alpha-glucosidase/alpha-galactosidase [Oscillospiraceae bacterium]|jgi:alpha-galactosidase|nr:alpha-glucosidase/alpha-galactosidase [Oscillospiraceae bacterium]
MPKITITYIGGGSKAWAHKYFADLLTQSQLEGELRLYDTDLPAARRNRKYFGKLVKANPDKIKSKWSCTVHGDIGTALPGSDFVIISILPYQLRNMYVDVHYPQRYGIWQPVGDSAGAGGYSRALRTIPSYIFFAKKIREHCPGAWVINYTNPMSLCMNTLYREFPEIKAFGCCHEVFGTQNLICRVAGMYLSLPDEGRRAFLRSDLRAVKAALKAMGKDFNDIKSFGRFGRHEISTNVQGVNHFTWIDKAGYGDLDLMPVCAAYARMVEENAAACLKGANPIKKRLRNTHHVKYALFEQCGALAAAGDRHLSEFVPEMFLTGRHVLKYGFELTPVWGRMLVNRLLTLRTALAATPFYNPKIKGSGEEGVKQIAAICGLGDIVTNVNLPNRGQLKNVVRGAAVETNAAFSRGSVTALDAGEMPPAAAALVNIHAQNQKDFTRAYFEKDKPALEAAFCRDPQVARIGAEKGKKLFAEMLRKNRKCLEGFLAP